MLLGFSVASHCNLRCPHCIRDDVVTPRELEPELIARVLDEAVALWGAVGVSLTGGEPLVHRRFADIVEMIASRGLSYRFVSNGWHLRRIVPLLRRFPPAAVRLSLSGGDECVHDADRGRGSFQRVMLGVALLTYLRIPTSLSIIVDRRSRRQVEEVAALAEGLGCLQLHYILPQPVPGSVERDSDLPPEEWREVVREVHALAARPGRRTAIQLDYGAPFDGEEALCDTFAGQRVYVDAEGRLSTCCQLSEYGENTADVVADLHQVSLADAWPAYLERLRVQQMGSARPASGADEFDDFPCIRCARFTGKMEWMRQYREHRWSRAVRPAGRPSGERTLVQLSRSPALSAVSDR